MFDRSGLIKQIFWPAGAKAVRFDGTLYSLLGAHLVHSARLVDAVGAQQDQPRLLHPHAGLHGGRGVCVGGGEAGRSKGGQPDSSWTCTPMPMPMAASGGHEL